MKDLIIYLIIVFQFFTCSCTNQSHQSLNIEQDLKDSIIENSGKKDNYLIPIFFEILGSLSERNIERKGLIEGLYQIEKEDADYINSLLVSYIISANNSNDIQHLLKKNGYIEIYSNIISNKINQFYVKDEESSHSYNYTLDKDIFKFSNKDCQISYIRGAYKRWGKKNYINAPKEVETIAFVLEKLGCTNIKKYYVQTLPSSNLVIFEPTEELKTLLDINNKINDVSEIKYYDYELFQIIN